MSAERLSQRVPMSRAVIANIESGRKKDVTVDEMLALAWALDIPPVALALPIEQPNVFLETARGEDRSDSVRAHTVIDWFITGKKPGGASTPQQMIAATRLRMLRDFYSTTERIKGAEAALASGDSSAKEILEEATAHQRDVTEGLYGLGLDLNYYPVDQTGMFDGDD